MIEPTIAMTRKDLLRYAVIRQLINGRMNGTEAAKQLNLSTRRVRTMKARVKENGPAGVIHRSRGKTSNRKTKTEIIEKAKQLLHEQYRDFKPTFASEKLKENHGITLSHETVRTVLTNLGLWRPRSRKKNMQWRRWRPRKEYFGEMQQFDGSYHDWFEGRAPRSCLLAAIDDATGKITRLEFTDSEGVIPVFAFWRSYINVYGKPASIYLDRHSTYHQNQKSVLNDPEHITQFERAMRDLDIRVIHAHSPQAKGRIERLFGTLQDRLTKELRLQVIETVEQANTFLQNTFIPKFNQRFGVLAEKKDDFHKITDTMEKHDFDRIFSIQKTRIVNNDFTIQYENGWYQLAKTQPALVCRKDNVMVEKRLNGEIKISLRGTYLNFEELPKRPEKTAMIRVAALSRQEPVWKPPVDHPWRQRILAEQKQKTAKIAILTKP